MNKLVSCNYIFCLKKFDHIISKINRISCELEYLIQYCKHLIIYTIAGFGKIKLLCFKIVYNAEWITWD